LFYTLPYNHAEVMQYHRKWMCVKVLLLSGAAQQAHASDVAVIQVPVSSTTSASKTTRVDVER
jgi:hypothetical protein